MGTGTLTSRSDGETIPSADHNELVDALSVDVVPRNTSRVATDIIGQLGTSLFRWLRIYVKEIFVGTAANNLKIYEGTSGELWLENPSNDSIRLLSGVTRFYIGTNLVASIDANGFNGADIKDNSIPTLSNVACWCA